MGKLIACFFYATFFLALIFGKPAETAHADAEATEFFRRTNGHIASDGGFSVPLKNGSTLWLMGDSHINDFDLKTKTVPCLFQVRNAALLQNAKSWNKAKARTLVGAGMKDYFTNSSGDSLFCWPFSGIQIGDTVFVYNNSLKKTNNGAFGFAPSGADFWAKIHYPDMKVVGYAPIADFKGINFGSGFIRLPGDLHVYAYGFRFSQKLIGCEVYVARFNETYPTKWSYWDGKSWQADLAKAAIIASQKEVSGTLQVTQINRRIVITTSEFNMDCDMGKKIFVSSAARVTGPFSEKKVIYSIPDSYKGHSPFFYAANLHPQFVNANKEVLLTYAINGYGKCYDVCQNGRMNPDFYRLKAVRVPLRLLDGK